MLMYPAELEVNFWSESSTYYVYASSQGFGESAQSRRCSTMH